MMTPPSKTRRAFWTRKLHSLTGVVPIGIFLAVHLYTYSRAIEGRRAFDATIRDIYDTPYLLLLEAFGIYLPLFFHAAYGIKISLEARPNLGAYPYAKNWSYTMQRVTGLVTLVFIAYHLWQFRIPVASGELARTDLFDELCASMSETSALGIPATALAYLAGIAAATYHLASGLYGFCFSWGITTSRRASRLASGVFGLFGVALFLLGANTILYLATGSAVVQPAISTAPFDEPVTCADSLGQNPLATGPVPGGE